MILADLRSLVTENTQNWFWWQVLLAAITQVTQFQTSKKAQIQNALQQCIKRRDALEERSFSVYNNRNLNIYQADKLLSRRSTLSITHRSLANSHSCTTKSTKKIVNIRLQ